MATKTPLEVNPLTSGLYTYAEAARLAGVHHAAVRVWIEGARPDGEAHPPPSDERGWTPPPVSFLQLIEVVAAARLSKTEGVRMAAVRKAHANAQQRLGIEHPFAHIELLAIGRHAVRCIRGGDPNGVAPALDGLTGKASPGIAALRALHAQVDYEGDLAARWWPDGKGVHVVIDPRYGGGDPTVAGRRLKAELLWARRFKVGESVEFMMQDLALDRRQVEDALTYWGRLVA